MSQKLFTAAAQALYGPDTYQSQVARDLGISLSSCVRYDNGQRAVPDELLDRLYGMLIKRHAEIGKLVGKLGAMRDARVVAS